MALTLLVSTDVMAEYPVGLQDQYIVRAGDSARLEVLNNDSGNGLRVASFNAWTLKGGRVKHDSSDRSQRRRRVHYFPPADFVGEDEFWYVLEDVQGRRNAAKVKITVKPEDSSALDPQNDQVSVEKDTAIRINALNNDGVLINTRVLNTAEIVGFNSWSQNGGRIERADIDVRTPQLQYTPKPGFVGTDEFWYTMISKPGDVEHAAKVTVTVTQNNSAGPYPFTRPDSYDVVAPNVVTRPEYHPLDNDSGNNLKIVDREGWSQKGGKYSVDAAGTLNYSPPRSLYGVGGQDKIWYTIEDEVGRTNWGVINFTIPRFYQG